MSEVDDQSEWREETGRQGSRAHQGTEGLSCMCFSSCSAKWVSLLLSLCGEGAGTGLGRRGSNLRILGRGGAVWRASVEVRGSICWRSCDVTAGLLSGKGHQESPFLSLKG